MADGAGRQLQLCVRLTPGDVDQGRADEADDHQRQHPGQRGAQEGHLEDVEAEVLPEHRVVAAEAGGVEGQRRRLPGARRDLAHEEGDHDSHTEDGAAKRRRQHAALDADLAEPGGAHQAHREEAV